MERVLIKIYAGLHPTLPPCLEAVQQAGASAIGNNGEPWLFYEGDLLRISFEGLYFPVDDVLQALTAHLPPHAEGKLDLLDLDAWELHRYAWQATKFTHACRDLNQVLDYAGH